ATGGPLPRVSEAAGARDRLQRLHVLAVERSLVARTRDLSSLRIDCGARGDEVVAGRVVRKRRGTSVGADRPAVEAARMRDVARPEVRSGDRERVLQLQRRRIERTHVDVEAKARTRIRMR